jgi:hypothetical protein
MAPVLGFTGDVTPFSRSLAGFTAARDALLLAPEADLSAYRKLVTETAAQVEPASLTLDELAAGSFEGLFDLPPSREAAAAAARAMAGAETADGARAAAVRLRLLGAITFAGAPDAAVQGELTHALVAHPRFPALLASSYGREALSALLRVGRTTVIRRETQGIVAAVRHLDPATSPERAVDLEGLGLLLALAIGDEAALAFEVRSLLEFGRQAMEVGDASARAAIEAQIRTLAVLLEPPREPRPSPTRREGEGPATEGEQGLNSELEVTSVLARRLVEGLAASGRVGGHLELELTIGRTRERTFLRVPDSWYESPREQTITADQVVVSEDGRQFRAFGGAHIEDPLFQIHASDVGFDRGRNLYLARDVDGHGELFGVRAGRLRVAGTEGSAERLRLRMGLGQSLTVARIEAGNLTLDREQRLRARDVSLRLLGIRVVGVGSVTGRMSFGDRAADPSPDEPDRPRGRSPTNRWLKLPSLGFEEGGVFVRYSNALKFAGRWTGITSLNISTAVDPKVMLGANYNLLDVTNDLDQFISAPGLQNRSLGSYYHTVRNWEPLRENEPLFDRKLFVGASTAWNVSYEDENSERHEANVPFSLGIGGGHPLFHVLGVRGQLSFERVEDEGFGADTRFSLTGVLGARSFEIMRGVGLSVRAEGTTRFGSDTDYTWYRANAGLTVLPIPKLRVSGSYFESWEKGEARFPYDRVTADQGVTARADLTLGRTRLGLMNQYSSRRGEWVRWQVFVARRVGLVEPFVAYDQQLSRYSFGVRLNPRPLLDQLRLRRLTGITTPAP